MHSPKLATARNVELDDWFEVVGEVCEHHLVKFRSRAEKAIRHLLAMSDIGKARWIVRRVANGSLALDDERCEIDRVGGCNRT